MRLLLLLTLLLPGWAAAAGFSVVSLSGDVAATVDGRSTALRVGDSPGAQLLMKISPGAMVQLRADDGSNLLLGESSEVRMNADKRSLALVRGQLSLWSDDRPWQIEAGGTQLRSHGFLRLKTCGEGCADRQGVYGKGHGGEVVVEYTGGRSVLRDRLFLIQAGGGKPEVLPRDTGFLGTPPRFDAAVAAKATTAQQLKAGLEDFRAGRYDAARATLTGLRKSSPGEPVIVYYLGLIALEQQRNDDALRDLQQYAKEDPDGARERDIAKLLTLLTSSELQREVEQALRQEKEIASSPPEPGTIAVQAFANRSSPASAALAKGIAAMVISDLSKVPGLKVLERQKVQKISDEIRLSASGLVDADSAVRAGRLMRAERVVVGSMGVE